MRTLVPETHASERPIGARRQLNLRTESTLDGVLGAWDTYSPLAVTTRSSVVDGLSLSANRCLFSHMTTTS